MEPTAGQGSAGAGPSGVPQAPHPQGWTVWALEQLRESMGLGHQAFAAYLEKSESWWSRVRGGQLALPPDRLRFIVQLRPWMAQFVALDYLADGNNAVVGPSAPLSRRSGGPSAGE